MQKMMNFQNQNQNQNQPPKWFEWMIYYYEILVFIFLTKILPLLWMNLLGLIKINKLKENHLFDQIILLIYLKDFQVPLKFCFKKRIINKMLSP